MLNVPPHWNMHCSLAIGVIVTVIPDSGEVARIINKLEQNRSWKWIPRREMRRQN